MARLTLDREQRSLLTDLRELSPGDEDNLAEVGAGDLDELEDKMVELLSSITENYDGAAWRVFAENNGLSGLNYFGGQIIQKVRSEQQDKMDAVEKFR